MVNRTVDWRWGNWKLGGGDVVGKGWGWGNPKGPGVNRGDGLRGRDPGGRMRKETMSAMRNPGAEPARPAQSMMEARGGRAGRAPAHLAPPTSGPAHPARLEGPLTPEAPPHKATAPTLTHEGPPRSPRLSR